MPARKARNTNTNEFSNGRRTKKPIDISKLSVIEPLTVNQRRLFESYKEGKHIIAHGVAGTGKTMCVLYNALRDVLDYRTPYDKIYIVRSLVPTREIGFLPGPQPLDAKILTPTGWSTMGEIKVGDYVIGCDGKQTKVTKVFPKGKKLVYKVTTTENTSTECCEDHLWVTRTYEEKKRGKPGSTKTTKQIIETLLNNSGKINHYLPRNAAIEFTKNNLPIPPYTLGVILGDGSISSSISFSNTDNELIERVDDEITSMGCYLTNNNRNITYTINNSPKNNKPAKRVLVTNLDTSESEKYHSIGVALESLNKKRSTLKYYCENNKVVDNLKYEFIPTKILSENIIKNELIKLGLNKSKCDTKFIPDLYKFSSIHDRIELLRGLMDTDGTVKKIGEASYTTTSKRLAMDVIEIVKSLGGRSVLCERDRVGMISYITDRQGKRQKLTCRLISYEFTISLPNDINPFFISRKAERFSCKYMHNIGIKSIEPIGVKEVKCISVDNSENLYITDDYIVTHNSHDDKSALYEIPYKNMVKGMFDFDNAEQYETIYSNLKLQGTISFWSTSFIRGTTFDRAIIIVDEFENLSFHENDSIITRVGEDCKICFCGDAAQSDLTKLSEKNGIIDFMRIINQMNSFDVIEFGIDDIVRSDFVKQYIIAKYNLGIR